MDVSKKLVFYNIGDWCETKMNIFYKITCKNIFVLLEFKLINCRKRGKRHGCTHTHTHTQLNLTNRLRFESLVNVGARRRSPSSKALANTEVKTIYNRVAYATLFLLSVSHARDG